jgi:hypothetical protein
MITYGRSPLRSRDANTNFSFRRVHQLKSLVGARLLAVRTIHNCAVFGNFRSVRPKRIVKKSVGLRFNLTVAEYSIAVLAVQNPLRHSVTLWRGAGLAVANNAKTQHRRMFHIEHSLPSGPEHTLHPAYLGFSAAGGLPIPLIPHMNVY